MPPTPNNPWVYVACLVIAIIPLFETLCQYRVNDAALLSYLYNMDDGLIDLRAVLSENIRGARKALHITQEKLAEAANISLSYMSDIEYRRTWVSDKTLASIAGALNMQAYQLLIPAKPDEIAGAERDTRILQRISGLVMAKRGDMRKAADSIMADLIQDIVKIYAETAPNTP
jgi:transcriptional regulator with XRE-family HTH domain